MTTPRTRAQVAANPTNVELRTKAFDERRALWAQEDEREEERLQAVGKTLADALLNSVNVVGDLQKEDLARLLCKVLAILDFRQYFLIDETSVSILQRLMNDFEEYSNKLVDPDVPDQYIRDLPLENLKIMLTARRGQLCARLELLRSAHNQLQSGQLMWDDVFVEYKTVGIQFWMEILDLTLVLRYKSGDALKEELQSRQVFLQESLTPVMDMFLMEVRDKQVRRPILYIDYMVMSPPSGTLRGDESEASVDTVLRPPNEEEVGQMGARVEAMALGPVNVPPGSATQMQPERAAAQAMGRPAEIKAKGASLKKIISLPGVSSDRKLQMLSQQLDQLEKKPADQLDALAGRLGIKTEEASTAAYGDEKAVAQYNALPNVQLPPFFGNSLEFAKWWQMFIYLVDKNPKIPQIMKLHILQKSLKGSAEYLAHQIVFSPSSYEILKENVKEAFDDADAALRLLADRIKAWPVLKRNDYKQLADFTGFATNYVMQLMQFEDGVAFNPRNVINELYGKFYPQMMGDYRRDWAQEEFLKGKKSDRDQVVWLLQWLKEKLKVAKAYYNADPNRQPIPLGMPSGIAMEFKTGKNQTAKGGSNSNGGKGATAEKKTVATADGLYATTDFCDSEYVAAANVRGRGRGFHGGRGTARGRGNQSNRGRGKPPNGTPSTGPPQGHYSDGAAQNPSPNPPGGKVQYPRPETGYDLWPCLFCGRHQHPARICPQHMKPDTVYMKAVEALLCLNCLRAGHYASSCPHPGCSMEGCNARHHKLLHGHKKNQ